MNRKKKPGRSFSRMGTLDESAMRQTLQLPPVTMNLDTVSENQTDPSYVKDGAFADSSNRSEGAVGTVDNSGSSGHVGELCRGNLKKYCSGNTFNKWQSRFARVVSYDSNSMLIVLEYANSEKDLMNDSKVKKVHLKPPGIQKFSALGDPAWVKKISGRTSLCCEICVSQRQKSGGKDHKGGHLVFMFRNQSQMEDWESCILNHFERDSNTEQIGNNTYSSEYSDRPQSDGGENVNQAPPPPPPGEPPPEEPESESDDDMHSEDPPPPPEEPYVESDNLSDEINDTFGDAVEDNTPSRISPPKEIGGSRSQEVNDALDPDIDLDNASKHQEAVVYDPKFHAQSIAIEGLLRDSGLGKDEIEVETLINEVFDELDASEGKRKFVNLSNLREWISDRLAKYDTEMEHMSNSTQLPVPRLSDTFERSLVHNRHMSGLSISDAARSKIEADVAGKNATHIAKPHAINDIRSSTERSYIPRERSDTQLAWNSISTSRQQLMERGKRKMNSVIDGLMSDGDSSAKLKDEHEEVQSNILNGSEDDMIDIDMNWNERFQSACEMPIEEFGLAVEKGMKLHRLRQKIARLASLATKTIIDEFSLPRRLKKIKPVRWLETSNDNLNVESEDMPNDIVYQYRSLLIRIVGVSSSIEDSQTFRKAAGNEVRGIRAFQEACTQVHQDMLARRLEKSGVSSVKPKTVPRLSVPFVIAVDYSGFRVLVSTIPPIDEAHSQVYGRVDPQDPNSTFEDFDPALSALLNAVSQELNLKDHKILAGGAARIISIGSEVQGHKCEDKRRYILNLGRIMPPDLPTGGSDITTKLLRPEFVHAYSVPLSSDAFSSIVMPPQNEPSAQLLDDVSSNDVNAGNASVFLQSKRIPEFVARLDTLSIFPYDSFTLAEAMHVHGINMRYLGRICELTKLPHIREMVIIEMLARTCKDILNENMRRAILDAHDRVESIIHDLAAQGRHLNDEAMAKLLQFNHQLNEDNLSNVVDYFNLALGKPSDHENNMFWQNVLIPRLSEKFNFYHQKTDENAQNGSDDPLFIGRDIICPYQMFHSMQYHCGVRFLSSEYFNFEGLSSPLKLSQIIEMYPKVKVSHDMSLEVNRVAAAAEVYRGSGDLNTALQAFRLRHNRVKNFDGIHRDIPCALVMNELANTLRLKFCDLVKRKALYSTDKTISVEISKSDEILTQALAYTEKALNLVDPTHMTSARIHETRMRIFSDLGDLDQMAIEFHAAISATLIHFGRSGMHPYVAELHCILGTLLASHNQIVNARKHLELARKLASRCLGPRHPVYASYTVEVGRVDFKAGDTFGAFEHYQQALILIFQSIGRDSLEAADILCEMARIKSMHGRQVGQIEAEEALKLAEQALRIREACAIEEVEFNPRGLDKKDAVVTERSNEGEW